MCQTSDIHARGVLWGLVKTPRAHLNSLGLHPDVETEATSLGAYFSLLDERVPFYRQMWTLHLVSPLGLR